MFLRVRHVTRRVLIGFVACLLMMAYSVAGADAAVFNPETFTLANGMQVVVAPNHRAPVVTHMVWYRVGSSDEPQGHSGIAHFLEHLMFKGTKKTPTGEFSRIVARHGGRENAFTSLDYTAYFQTIAKDRLEEMMTLEADRMRNLTLSEEQVATERNVILEERRQRVENEPAALLDEQVDAALFMNHPYRRPVIGWEHEIEELNRETVLAFYRRWYNPANAILIVGGDITAAELRPLAEKTYGAIPKEEAENGRELLTEPPHQAARRLSMSDSRVGQPVWQRLYLAPSYLAGETEHAYPLQVLSYILGENATSRLYQRLVVDEKIAVSAGAGYDPTSRGPAQFYVAASPRPGVSMDDLEAAIDRELDAVLAQGVSAEEVASAIRRLKADAIYVRDLLSAGARILGEALAIGLTVEDVESWPDRIAEVTPDQVQAAAHAVLDLVGR